MKERESMIRELREKSKECVLCRPEELGVGGREDSSNSEAVKTAKRERGKNNSEFK